MIAALPYAEQKEYILFDSWPSASKIIHACLTKGMHVICAIKTNRIIYLNGERMPVSDYAKKVPKSEYSCVKAGSKEYLVYGTECERNKVGKVKIVLSYPKNAYGNPIALHVFIAQA